MALFRQSRRPLLSSCAIASAMVALGHGPAAAQSFQGGVIGAPTNAIVNSDVPGQTTVTVTAPTAIINWQPNDTAAGTAPINFQDAGTTATFESTGGDYTVLNRIIPTGAAGGRSVLLNGNIESFIGEGGGTRGGAVWFYSPNGLIVGSQASINVGSLLLTTRNLSDTEFLTSNGVYNFGATDDSHSMVTIQAGAQIDAASLLNGSYVAVVAPRIVQAGDVRVDGSVAYVAAEQATITISNNLFDIQVQSGSATDPGWPGDDLTLNHTGSTGGPASTGASDPHSIYMVAIPKNEAITMLVGGNIGYDASMASVENGRVILSAGSNINSFGDTTGGPASGVVASLSIYGGNFTSSTFASARTNALALASNSFNLSFSDRFSLTAGRSATLIVDNNATLNIGGPLNVTTLNLDNSGNAARGTATVSVATGGNLSVAGDTFIDASSYTIDAAQAGSASLTAAARASIELQFLNIYADAGSSVSTAQGGDASLTLTGADLSAQNVVISATGFAGGSLNGATGTGGNASIDVTNATLSVGDQIFVGAQGNGGSGGNGGAGGLGQGGAARFSITGVSSSVQADSIDVNASGFGGGGNMEGSGDGVGGGDGTGGTASFALSGGSLSAVRLTVDASATGGDGLASETTGVRGGAAGGATGGDATASLTGEMIDLSVIGVTAAATGGNGGDGREIFDEFGYGTGTSPDGGNGGFGIGGSAQLTIDGSLNAGGIDVDAEATGGLAGASDFGAIGSGANATGGSASLALRNIMAADPGSVAVRANATGSDGGAAGGNAIGGDATISLTASDNLAFGSTILNALARGGQATTTDGTAGDATGGNISLILDDTNLSTASLTFFASGGGGNAFGGVAGDGQGGSATLQLTGSSFAINDTLALLANGTGGASDFRGGDGTGGDISLTVDAASSLSTDFSPLRLSALGTGSDTLESDASEIAGSATGGNITLSSAGTISAGSFELSASAVGGSSAGVGGTADGGTISFTAGGGLIDAGASVRLTAQADGGDGISGGDATGGAITVAFSGNGNLSSNGSLDVLVSAYGGEGGYSGDGGDATGGSIDFTVADASTETRIETGYGIQMGAVGVGGRSTNRLADGTGSGGNGGGGSGGRIAVRTGAATIDAPSFFNLFADGSGGGVESTNGNGGAGTGGDLTLDLAASTVTTSSIRLDAGASGGSAAEFGYGTGGDGGAATAGSARLLLGGGTVDTQTLSIDATALGGSGGDGDSDDGSQDPINGGIGGNATGGLASLSMQGGSLTVGEFVDLDAGANAGSGGIAFATRPGNGGAAAAGGANDGGGAIVSLTGGATLQTPNLSIQANAVGGDGGYALEAVPGQPGGADGGNAIGGLARVSIAASDLTTSQATIQAMGRGGDADFGSLEAPPALSGSGTGGSAELSIDGGNASLDILVVDARGIGGGFLFVGSGDANGGTARITASGGSLSVATDLVLTAYAESSAGIGLVPTVTGGLAEFSASNGTSLTLGSGRLRIDASAVLRGNEGGGESFSSLSIGSTDIGTFGVGEGQAVGGTASFVLDGASLELGNGLILDAGAYVEPAGASAQGGSTSLAVVNGGALSVGGGIEMLATGIATDGDIDGTGQGGNGIGGNAAFRVDGGSVLTNAILIDARGTGGGSTLLTAGGSGTGGNITIDIVSGSESAGTVDALSLTALADGTGGSALVDPETQTSGTDGGAGTGGSIAMAVSGALTLEGGEGGSPLLLSANGRGGDAFAGGTAGAGTGGSVSLTTAASSIGGAALTAATITLSADGLGGLAIDPSTYSGSTSLDLAAASGGNGSGGTVLLAANGGTITANAVTVSATGEGRDGAAAGIAGNSGGNGGNGEGGAFTLSLGGGTLAAPLSALVGSTAGSGGNGGVGAAGGSGGNAAGGAFAVNLLGDGQTFALSGGLTLDLSAIAGNGGDAGGAGSGPGANGGDGGSATGGNLTLATSANGGSLTLGSLDLNASATGGNGGLGGAGTTAGLTGAGGNGTGGSATLTAGPGTLATGNANIMLDGRGGNGRSGGSGTGGAFNATATGGTIQIGTLMVSANGFGGNGSSGAGGNGSGGEIRLATNDAPDGASGQIVAGGTTLETSAVGGAGATAGTAAAGSIDIVQQSASPAGLIGFGSLIAIAQGAAADSATSAISLQANGGTIAIAGGAFIDAATAARLDGTGAIGIGGDLDVSAGQLATVGSLSANRVVVTSGGDILVSGPLTSANDLRLVAVGAASGNALQAGGDVYVDADSIAFDAITTTGDGEQGENGYGSSGAGNVSLFAGNGITVDGIDAAGDVMASDGGTGGILIDRLLSGGGAALSSEGGTVTVATDLQSGGPITVTGTEVTLRSQGALAVDSITATTGNVLVDSGGALDLGQILAASGGFQALVRGTAMLGGTIDATSIAIASHDIVIGSDAMIGVNTDIITLSNIGTRSTRVGGGDAGDAWSLSNDEFGRLSAHTIAINAAGEANGRDMTVGQLDIIGAAGSDSGTRRRNLTGSDMILTASGSILVDGAVALINAGGDDRLMLSAGDNILVDTATGSIVMTGQGGALGGTLAMDARTIFVGTAQAWTDINALSSIDARNQRLGDNDGIVNPEGFLRADAMEFGASRGLYIQNTGTGLTPSNLRAGFTVGSGGVAITPRSDEGPPLEIVINGRQRLSDGTFATGTDLIPLLQLRGEGEATMARLDPRSTANGCLIVTASCDSDVPGQIGIPQQDVVNALEPDEPFDGGSGLIRALNPPIIQFAETIGISSDPVIDEPVTGTANESMWLGDNVGGGSDIDQQVTGTRNDDNDEDMSNGPAVDEQVTGTRNENLDEQVTGTRNDNRDEAERPQP